MENHSKSKEKFLAIPLGDNLHVSPHLPHKNYWKCYYEFFKQPRICFIYDTVFIKFLITFKKNTLFIYTFKKGILYCIFINLQLLYFM